MKSERYGKPPDKSECSDAGQPDFLKLKSDQMVILPDIVGMHEYLGKPVSVTAVARQLNRHFDFGRQGPVNVFVKGYGYFRIGPSGWCFNAKEEE